MRRPQVGVGRGAKPLVTSKLADYVYTLAINESWSTVICLKVKIVERVEDKHYRAIATLEDGRNVRIMIEDSGDEIHVNIPYPLLLVE